MPDVSHHRSMDVRQSYVRGADMFRDHAGAGCREDQDQRRRHPNDPAEPLREVCVRTAIVRYIGLATMPASARRPSAWPSRTSSGRSMRPKKRPWACRRLAGRLTIAAMKEWDCRPFSALRLDREKAVMNHAGGIKHLTNEAPVRIHLPMSVAPADIRSLRGHVEPRSWDGAALRALRFTFASFTSRRRPRS
jgi:hypothetical protein